MPSERFADSLNQQVGREFSAAQQYIAVAVFYEAQTLPRLAAFFFRQALEERAHAMMMLRYLLDADVDAVVPGVDPPRSDFSDVVEPVRIALDQERRVSDQVGALAAMAREDADYLSEQFLQWFLKEQVEEVASMTDLLRVVERGQSNLLLVEEYMAREQAAAPEDDPTAPPIAGGAV